MIAIHWFRRDLRLADNTALWQALNCGLPVLPLFIFDEDLLSELPRDDARISFIYQQLSAIHSVLQKKGSGIIVKKGKPEEVWAELLEQYPIQKVFFNKDYEPYTLVRDEKIFQLLTKRVVSVEAYKDQVVFEEDEIIKKDGNPYTVYTPYKNRWLEHFHLENIAPLPTIRNPHYQVIKEGFPSLKSIGFRPAAIEVKAYQLKNIPDYPKKRDIPSLDATTYLSPHLRFGTIGIRQLLQQLKMKDELFLSELIWREFFMQILYHFPRVVHHNFKSKYDSIHWRNDENEFQKWCEGNTGYPLVDAGMRQLNQSGYIHNRVRMITAGFLCKHLLIDWRWGEAYFAQKLLDYELSSNNGNWQWAAGTGCDAAPYFRIFNPISQQKQFDPDLNYIKRWIPEYGTDAYAPPMVDHKYARERALEAYGKMR